MHLSRVPQQSTPGTQARIQVGTQMDSLLGSGDCLGTAEEFQLVWHVYLLYNLLYNLLYSLAMGFLRNKIKCRNVAFVNHELLHEAGEDRWTVVRYLYLDLKNLIIWLPEDILGSQILIQWLC